MQTLNFKIGDTVNYILAGTVLFSGTIVGADVSKNFKPYTITTTEGFTKFANEQFLVAVPKVEEYNGYSMHINNVVDNPNGRKTQTILIYKGEKMVDAVYADVQYENPYLKAIAKIDKL